MLKIFAVAVGAALVALVPGVASAQGADDGILCVYDAVSTQDYETVAEGFLYGDDDAMKTADTLLAKETQTCSDKFKFSEKKRRLHETWRPTASRSTTSAKS